MTGSNTDRRLLNKFNRDREIRDFLSEDNGDSVQKFDLRDRLVLAVTDFHEFTE